MEIQAKVFVATKDKGVRFRKLHRCRRHFGASAVAEFQALTGSIREALVLRSEHVTVHAFVAGVSRQREVDL